MRKICKGELGMDKFENEEQRINQHMLNVYKVEKLWESSKILSDTRETTALRDSQVSH